MTTGERFDMPEVTLADGTVLHADLWASGNAMWIWIRDAADPYNSIRTLGDLLSGPGVTDTVTRSLRGELTEYAGYTVLTNVRYYQAGLVGARLEKGAADVHT